MATLKKCFSSPEHALEVFTKELKDNIFELERSSLFFTFSSDPMIRETEELNWMCITEAVKLGVRCQVLTKNAEFPLDMMNMSKLFMVVGRKALDMVAFGFTLTGCDDLEPGASSNNERINAMRLLHSIGFRTFASLEPVVVPAKTAKMARMAADCCDLYKVGLQSGVPKSYYAEEDIFEMVHEIEQTGVKTYYKHSLTSYLNHEEQEPVDIFEIII